MTNRSTAAVSHTVPEKIRGYLDGAKLKIKEEEHSKVEEINSVKATEISSNIWQRKELNFNFIEASENPFP